MTAARFIALRDRGTELWTEIEAHRLAHVDLRLRTSRRNTHLSIAAAIAGAIAGASGAKLFGELGQSGLWITGGSGLVAAITAALNPILKLGEEAQKATEHTEKLAAMQGEITNHIYRMQTEDKFTAENQQLFFVRLSDTFASATPRHGARASDFTSDATSSRNAKNFPKQPYIGAELDLEEEDDIQAPSADIVAFGAGG